VLSRLDIKDEKKQL